MNVLFWRLCAAVLLAPVLASCGGGGGSAAVPDTRAVVYAMANNFGGNRIFAWRLNANGTLQKFGEFGTGGNGPGADETPGNVVDGRNPLGSQGSLFMHPNRSRLFAVNAGSSTISVFRIGISGGLTLIDVESSGGTNPVSITARASRVYVVNVNDPQAGQAGLIRGFSMDANGLLTPIPGAVRVLSAPNARPSQISFTPDGTKLVVTERTTNVISVFTINANGTLQDPVVTASAGPVPYGFDYAGSRLVVSEADTQNSSASSYGIGGNGALTSVTARLLTNQRETGWMRVSSNGQKAYASNFATHNVTSFDIDANGALSIRQAAVPAGANSFPIDSALAPDGSLFLQLLGGTGEIASYSVGADGSLSLLGIQPTGLPALGSQGLVIR